MAYTQAWLRGEANVGADFVNEGLRLSDGSGWVAIGDTNIESENSNKNEQVKATKKSKHIFILVKWMKWAGSLNC